MANLAKYVVTLEAETAKYQRELTRANRKLDRFEQNNRRSLDNIKKSFIRFGGALAGVLAVREMAQFGIQASNTMTLVENRIRLVTDSVEELNAVQAQLFQVAQDTRSAFAPTVELYARVARSTKELGLSQQDVIDLTKTVNQAIQISGATSQEASAGVIQFAQALASGELRGEELRSVMEQLSGLSLVLARGLGVTVGELRTMAEAGELTAGRIIAVLKDQAPQVAAEFEQITPTISSAFQTLQNSLVQFSAGVSESTGFTDLLVESLQNLSEVIDDISTTTEMERLQSELDELQELAASVRERMGETRRTREGLLVSNPEMDLARLEAINAKIIEIAKRMSELRNRGDGLSDIQPISVDSEANLAVLNEALERWRAAAQKNVDELWKHFADSYATVEQQVASEMERFDIVAHLFPPEEQERIRDAIRAPLFEGLEMIEVESSKVTQQQIHEMLGGVDEVNNAAQELGLTFASAFEEAILQAKSLRDVVRGLLQDILRIIVRKSITEPIADFVTGLFDGKAMGGPVAAGTPYIVGERGPEVFVPSASGRIVPNGEFGGPSVQIVQHIQAGLPPQWQAQLAFAGNLAAAQAEKNVSERLGGRR